jgi:hypothetical protein
MSVSLRLLSNPPVDPAPILNASHAMRIELVAHHDLLFSLLIA